MRTNLMRVLVALALAAAMALPSAALARGGSGGHSSDDVATHTEATDDHGVDNPSAADDNGATPDDAAPARPRAARVEKYVLRGTVVSVDTEANTMVVTVKKANKGRRGRAYVGQELTLDLSGANVNAADFQAGDAVEVRVKLSRAGDTDISQPVAAQRVKHRARG
jgi:hypothetical protein